MDTIDLRDLAQRIGGADSGDFLFSALLDDMPSGVIVMDAASRKILLANSQVAEIFGASRERLEDPAWTGYHTDGRPYSPGEWPVERVRATGEAVNDEEVEVIRPDGARAIVRISARPLHDDKGEMTAILAVLTDITQQRRRFVSRRFLADAGSLLSSSNDPVTTLRNIARLAVPTLADWCTIDLVDDGRIERVAVEHIDRRKARAASVLARRFPPGSDSGVGVAKAIYTRKSELIPRVTPEIIAELSQNRSHRRILEELGMRSVLIVPLIARGTPLGAITFISAESGRVYTSEEQEIGEELAARAALAIENSRLLDESLAATEAKSDFLAVMSHELRTPLTAIIGYAELLQLGVPEPVTPRQHEQAERIEVSARHLLQLIEEILMLVTLDSGEERMRNDEVAVNDMLERASAIVDPMARAKDLPLRVTKAASDVVLKTDPDKLLQILLNLLSNAVKFTETGEIHLSALVDSESVVFCVEDTGIGLDPDHRKRIFEPFWQVERPITRRAGGTGLGLTVSRRLADLLGAEIEVDSEEGKGSTFRVRMPL